MLVDERKAHLLRVLAQTGRVVAKDVSLELGVSEDTIRRDLRELAGNGRLKRVHGGAVPLSPALAPYAGRQIIANDEKAAIGDTAARLVEDGQLVFLDGGTTALQVARALRPGLRATVVTHSPVVALELMRNETLAVEMVGGRLFRHSIVATGAASIAFLDRYRPDLCFIGATGVHPDEGITTGDSEEAEVKRAVIARSGAAFILASSEKMGAVSSFVLAGLDDIEAVITTAEAPPTLRAALAARGCRILLGAED